MTNPIRTCIGCGRTDAQRNLLRLIRIDSGHAALDPTRRSSGRGAYVHPLAGCLERGLTPKALSRAFRARTGISPEVVAEIRALAEEGGHRTER